MNNNNGYKLFAQLCENVMFEASSSMELIKGLPGGAQVIQHLHREGDLGHTQSYRPISKISWSELKDSYRGAWVIMQYKNGVGAIKATGGNTGSYVAAASTGGAVENYSDSRGGNVLDFLKSKLGGNPIKLWAGKETGDTKQLKKTRAQAKQELEKTTTLTPDALVKKFSPLWVKAMTVAQADIKGMVQNMIKNDAYEKAERKLRQLRLLDDGIMSIESDKTTKPDFLNAAIGQAITMTASHYYPDETGNISRSYSSGFTPERQEGVQHVLKDISAGDQAKLGTLLAFFKRALITG